MPSAFSWPVLVPCALRAPAPVNLGVRLPVKKTMFDSTHEHGPNLFKIFGFAVASLIGWGAYLFASRSKRASAFSEWLSTKDNFSKFAWRLAFALFFLLFGSLTLIHDFLY